MSGKIKRLLVLMGCLAGVLAGCRARQSGLYQLIDHFGKRDVVLSPLTSLERYFSQRVESQGAADFRKLPLESQIYWAAAPAFPLASIYDFEEPPDVIVVRDGKNLDYSGTPLPDVYTWRWLKGEKRVEFEDSSKRTGTRRSLTLDEGEAYETNLILPPGRALVKVKAKSGGAGPAALEMSIDGQAGRRFPVGEESEYEFTADVKLGENKIRLSFPKPLQSLNSRRPGEKSSLSVDLVTVKVDHDLILISPPEGETTFKGSFEFRYVPEPLDKIIVIGKPIESSEPFPLILDFDSAGKKEVTILTGPVPGPGSIEVDGDGGRVVAKIPVRPGKSSYKVQLEARRPTETVRLIYEPGGAVQGKPSPRENLFLDSALILNPVRERYLPLYRLEGFRLFDLGAGENPYFIKKKFKVRDQSLNCLFAPPPSLYRFRFKVPPRAVLRLGYGLLAEAWDDEGDGVTFEVLLEESGRRISLHRARVDPFHLKEDQRIFSKDLDLSDRAGQELTVYFKTEAGADFRNDFSFWLSPLLVQMRDKSARGERPLDIILISIDTLRADHLSCYGYGRPTSPNIDDLSRDSALFLNTLSPAPFTLPAHMSMLTGLIPTHHQVLYIYQSLDPEVTTLADVLRSSGYLTAAYTDGALVSARYGFSKGFESFAEEPLGYFIRNSAELLYKKASAWIKKNQDQQFFLFLHTYQPHDPYDSPEPLGQIFLKKDDPWTRADLSDILGRGHPHLFKELKPSERENLVALYDGEIRYADESLIKPLVAHLKSLGLYETTLIVLTSDHGEEFFEHGAWAHSLTLYNEEIKVPLIIKYPHSKNRGRRITPYKGLIDIMPTILEEAGVSHSDLKLDGGSLSESLAGRDRKERDYVSFRGDSIVNGALPTRVAIIRSPYKFILNEKYPAQAYEFFSPAPPRLDLQELYNLRLDPLEKRNLADQERNLARELMNEAEAYLFGKQAGAKSRSIGLEKSFEEKLRALGYLH